MTKTIATIILAAGASTRMGTPKQLLPYGGTSLLRHVVEEAIASVCQPVIVVLGANAEKIYPSLNQLPIQIVENLHWNQGIGTSIQTGMQSLSHLVQGQGDAEMGRRGEKIQTEIGKEPEFERLKSLISVGVSNPWDLCPRVAASPRRRVFFDEKIAAVILTLGDQPFLSAQILNRIVEAYYNTEKPIIASEYAGTWGVPALFDCSIFSELIALKQTEGAKQIIKKHHHQTCYIPFPQGEIDIDTPQDYQKLQTITKH